jgi:hypothetical protein
MINVGNIERDVTITRINYYYFHYSSFNNRKLIIVIYRKNVLIDAFVLNEIIRIMVKMIISP